MQNSDCLFLRAMKTDIFWLARFAGNEGMNQNYSQSIPTQSIATKYPKQIVGSFPTHHQLLFFLCIRKAHWCFFLFGTAKKSKKRWRKSCRFKFGVFFWRVVLVTKPTGSTSNDKVSSLQVHPKS